MDDKREQKNKKPVNARTDVSGSKEPKAKGKKHPDYEVEPRPDAKHKGLETTPKDRL